MIKDTVETFVIKCKKKFPDLIYDDVIFTDSQSPVYGIKCPIHGELKIKDAANFLSLNYGCSECYNKNKKELQQKQKQEKFINDSIRLFGNRFSYDSVEYVNTRTKVKIKCNNCGNYFLQYPNNFLRPEFKCPKCIKPFTGKIINLDKEIFVEEQKQKEFIEESKRLHVWLPYEIRDKNLYPDGSPKYDYSLSEYKDTNTKVKIICPIHGIFEQTPGNHNNKIKPQHCPECSKLYVSYIQRKSTEQFIEESKKIYGDLYTYEKVNYIKKDIPVILTCKKHGDFEVRPDNHLHIGSGCPICSNSGTSKLEQELIDFVKSIYNGKISTRNKMILNNHLELDIYIPDKNLAIEFDGLYWHSELQKSKDYHFQKTIECEEKGIQLIHIFEDEWIEKQEIVKSRLKQLLGVTEQKIYARKCKIDIVGVGEEKEFVEKNHLQGYIHSEMCYGLYYENELVSIMSFGQTRNMFGKNDNDTYEIYRFCNKINTNIIGGASKLFKHFIKEYNPTKVISYANRRYSTNIKNNVYKNMGFLFDSNTVINYFYIDLHKRKVYNRTRFNKKILIEKYGCPENMTEKDFCKNELKLVRIYDCGNLKYVWTPHFDNFFK